MANYLEERVKLTNTQLSKLKSAANNKAGKIYRINKKDFKDKELLMKNFNNKTNN